MSTTTKLLDAAEQRMRKGGYNAVSFRELAEDTGIKSSSVHYHFPKKEDLGSALVKRYAERFFENLNSQASDANTPIAKLNAFSRVYRTALTEDKAICLCGLLGAEIKGLPHPLAHGIKGFFDENITWIEQALPREIPKSKRCKIARTVVASHQGALMLATSMDDITLFDMISETSLQHALSLH